MKRARPAIHVIALVGVLGVALPSSAIAGFRITHAFVPGIGRIGTVLPRGTQVQPPAEVPRYAHKLTSKELDREQRYQDKVANRIHPGPDVGPPETVREVKHAVVKELFLREAAVACDWVPRAGLAVYAWVHVSPAQIPEVNQAYTWRKQYEGSKHCVPTRLRVDRWARVRIRDSIHADVMLRGAYEYRGKKHWRQSRRIWYLAMRKKSDRWRISVVAQDQPDEHED